VLGVSSIPSLEVLFCVLVSVGLPYVLLSANSTLIQTWMADEGKNVYHLYAISNAGSFVGLLAYPFIIEPYIPLTMQWFGFAVAFAIYTLLVGVVTQKFQSSRSDIDQSNSSPKQVITDSPSPIQKSITPLLWLILPAVSVFMLNAITTHLTLDVMPLPLLWVVLLGLFLLSYVVGFSTWSERLLIPFSLLTTIAMAGIALTYRKTGANGGFAMNLGACLTFCFVGCTFIHSWLFHLRPHTNRLTHYYLFNALGGAVGGLTASLAMPMLFKTVVEFPAALILVLLLVIAFGFSIKKKGVCAFAVSNALIACASLAALLFSMQPRKDDRPVIHKERGFFGTLQVLEAKARTASGEGVIHEFVHGKTVHGIQALIPGKERMPTTYFTAQSGGYAILAHPKYRSGEPMRVNILGLGVGVMLCYARTNDYYRCYEISPQVLSIAKDPSLFTFVKDCPAKLEILCEVARKGLEKELAADVEKYDMIQIDAFTGDNLPYHLSTREAFELYFKMLKPDGILAVNISNWHLGLEPFVKAMGEAFNCPVLVLSSGNDYARLAFASKFAFFCRTPEKLGPLPQGAKIIDLNHFKNFPVPTDEKGSFISLINW
jgi:hypothetical protein